MAFHVWLEGMTPLEGILRKDLERAAQLGNWCDACAELTGSTAEFFLRDAVHGGRDP